MGRASALAAWRPWHHDGSRKITPAGAPASRPLDEGSLGSPGGEATGYDLGSGLLPLRVAQGRGVQQRSPQPQGIFLSKLFDGGYVFKLLSKLLPCLRLDYFLSQLE